MLFYVELVAQFPFRILLSITFLAADQSEKGNDDNLSDSLHLYDLQPGTLQCNTMPAFELPDLSVTSEENGCRVNMVYGASSCCKIS